MSFDQQTRLTLLLEQADSYIAVALKCLRREFPVMPCFIMTGPGPYPSHRDLHPAFYGCSDWHSAVEMHWVLVRLLRLFPHDLPSAEARGALHELLTDEHIAAEVAFFSNPDYHSMERPYGWGWLLMLQHELSIWNDEDGQRWAGTVAPLADLFATELAGWLGVLTYPQRTGLHPNTAFWMSCAHPAALARASAGDERLSGAIHASATHWFSTDVNYPAHYEPSGADFLSPALAEAELMSRILGRTAFAEWFKRFLPGIEHGQPRELFHPATVSDSNDGQVGHLHGLNLSRAWAFAAIADRLPTGDPRVAPMLTTAERHSEASLSQVSGSPYALEHWLAAYATLLLSS